MGVPPRPPVEIRARSTLRDGVRVKKASSKQRAGADYNTRLEKGYFVKDGIFPQFLARRRTAFRSPRLSYFRTFWPIRGRQSSCRSRVPDSTRGRDGTVSSVLKQITITARYGKRDKSAIRKTIMMEC